MSDKSIIGPTDTTSFPEIGGLTVDARIDTGAETSSIWAAAIEDNKVLKVSFMNNIIDPEIDKVYSFDDYKKVKVTSSNGIMELRYKIYLLVVISGRKVRARFTLSDRTNQTYPVLSGAMS